MSDDFKHIGHKIIIMMDRMGIAPLPRNYNLLYSAIFNADADLRKAVRGLRFNAPQNEIDQVIEKYVPEALGISHTQKQQNQVLLNINKLLSSLDVDREELESYMAAVGRVSGVLTSESEKGKLTPGNLKRITDALVEASQRKIEAGNKTIEKVGENRTELERVQSELRKMTHLANHDQLTGLKNRRAFDERITAIYNNDLKDSYSLIVLDIDHFKKVNDIYGHAGGDDILRHVAHTIKNTSRSDSFVARTGGEEFAVIVKTSDEVELNETAERIRLSVEALEVKSKQTGSRPVKVTISLGGASGLEAETAELLYQNADSCLYRSKEGGRNRTTIFKPVDLQSTHRFKKLYEHVNSK